MFIPGGALNPKTVVAAGNKKIKLALIGAGGIGARWVRAIKMVKGVELKAIADKNRSRAESAASQFRNCFVSIDYRQIIKLGNIDGVIIAVPHYLLAPITLTALKLRKHVLCEKPGAVKSADLKKAVELAQRNSLSYMVGFNHRFHPAFSLARKFFEQGKIGEVLFIRARYGFGGRAGYEKEWRLNKKISGGGELIDQGVHMIDMARFFLGDIKEIKGLCGNLFWKAGVEDNAFVLLRSRSNKLASIHVSWTNWKPIHSFEIYGTKGYLAVEGLGRKYGGEEKLIWGARGKNFAGPPQEKVYPCDPEADKSLALELKEFIKSIRAKCQPQPSGEDALAVLEVIEKIYGAH